VLPGIFIPQQGLTGIAKVFPDGAIKNVGRLRHDAHTVRQVHLGQVGHFPAVDLHAAAGVAVELRDALGESALAAAGKPHQGELLAGIQVEVHLLQQLNPARDTECQILSVDIPLKGVGFPVKRLDSVLRLDVEILHQALVPRRGILVGLVKVHQFLPGIVELFVGGKKGHQCAQVEPTVNGKVAADDEENEWP